MTVGPPIDLLVYSRDALRITRHRRFHAKDPDFLAIQTHWEQALRKAVQEMPPIEFGEPGPTGRPPDTPRWTPSSRFAAWLDPTEMIRIDD